MRGIELREMGVRETTESSIARTLALLLVSLAGVAFGCWMAARENKVIKRDSDTPEFTPTCKPYLWVVK